MSDTKITISVQMFEDMADRIEELEAKLRWVLDERDATFALMLKRAETAEAKLAKAVNLIELAIELGRWALNPSFRDELITFTAELTGGKDE